MNKDKYCGEVYLELTFWSNVRYSFPSNVLSLCTMPRRSHLRRKKSRLSILSRISCMADPDLLFRLETQPAREDSLESHPQAACMCIPATTPFHPLFKPLVLLLSSTSMYLHTNQKRMAYHPSIALPMTLAKSTFRILCGEIAFLCVFIVVLQFLLTLNVHSLHKIPQDHRL